MGTQADRGSLLYPDEKKEPIVLAQALGTGASGTVYRIENHAGRLVKRYQKPETARKNRRRIQWMIKNPPSLFDPSLSDNTSVQLAWPMAEYLDARDSFRGFLMPEIRKEDSFEFEDLLQKKTRAKSGIPERYTFRIEVAIDLASLIKALHAQQYWIIDLKPLNIRVIKSSWKVALYDCDGFSIGTSDGSRFPAEYCTPEYICPESPGDPKKLGREQDLFALGVIIFTLLNNGRHPYHGKPRQKNLPNDLQERINRGLYAYGVDPNPEINPANDSIHEYLDPGTRELFDRAFQTRKRPTAWEWELHLRALTEVVKTCSNNPDHAYFSKSKGCGLCALEGKSHESTSPPRKRETTPNRAISIQSTIRSSPVRTTLLVPSISATVTTHVTTNPSSSQTAPKKTRKWPLMAVRIFIIAIILIITIILITVFGPRENDNTGVEEKEHIPSVTKPMAPQKPELPQEIDKPKDEVIDRTPPPSSQPAVPDPGSKSSIKPQRDPSPVDSNRILLSFPGGAKKYHGTDCGGVTISIKGGNITIRKGTVSKDISRRWRHIRLTACVKYRGRILFIAETSGPKAKGVKGIEAYSYGSDRPVYGYYRHSGDKVIKITECFPRDFPIQYDTKCH